MDSNMRIKIVRNIEVYIKSKVNRLRINKDDFSIISNNCWGTFIYKKFGLPYQSPFVNLFIFAPDYIKLLENFSPDLLDTLTFIQKDESKYKKELIELNIYKDQYPIGLLDGNIELHFLHYVTKEDALNKWKRRCKKINYDRLIFKFSDGDNCEDKHIKAFDKFSFKNKVCFTSKPFNSYKSVIFIEKYKHESRVRDEWKSFHKHFDIVKQINNLD